MIWIPQAQRERDTHAAFRGHFELTHDGEVELRVCGASWFNLWLDGRWLHEGPERFHPRHPEYQTLRVRLARGRHVLAAQVHDVGADTRMLPAIAPFLHCVALLHGAELPIAWSCRPLDAYQRRVRRINPQLGWIEWCDTRQLPHDWQHVEFDDANWPPPAIAQPEIGELGPATLGLVQQIPHALRPIDQGLLVERFAYELDDPPVRFLLRDLHANSLPPQGLWRRYDVGHVRLGRAVFTMDLPAGTVLEIAHAESLTGGRVGPHINASAGQSCNMHHYVARGGVQTFRPLTPLGGRFIEVHVLADPAQVRFIDEKYLERSYHGEAQGSLGSGEELLDRIWQMGVQTYRACSEDAIIDNPTRERGQWTGDVIVGMEVAAVAYSELRLARRALLQAAHSARDDGLVAALCPGQVGYIPWYAVQWMCDCVRYVELSGDVSLLHELYEPARRNMAALRSELAQVPDLSPMQFIVDWGFVREHEAVQTLYILMQEMAQRALRRWASIIGAKPDDEATAAAAHVARIVGDGDWDRLGYHATALALAMDLLDASHVGGAVEAIKRHLMSGFPNDPDAPRFAEPGMMHRRIITPYFMHFSLPPLIERGEMDFALAQYRRCWGWMLEQGATTMLEVFDPRWSHCHQWSACPTWQLSRYLLGLHPRFDSQPDFFELRLETGSLMRCRGSLPLPGGEVVEIFWERCGGQIGYQLSSPRPLVVLHDGQRLDVDGTVSLALAPRST